MISDVLKWGGNLLEPKPFVYVALGDSTAEGVGASMPERSYTRLVYRRLCRQYRNVHYYNFGRDSAKSRDVLDNQTLDAIGCNPDLITLSIGANDIRFGVTIRTFTRQLKKLLQRLQDKTYASIIIATIPDFSMVPRVPVILKIPSSIAIARYNKVIKQTAMELNITYADVFPQNAEYFRLHPETVAKDGFHPSDFGYAVWANALLLDMQKLGIIS